MSSSFDATDPVSDGDLTDMLGELRVLLPGSQLLSGFLIAVPFAPGFARMVGSEQYIFLATFLFALISLVFLSAPAIQHRLIRPLRDRERFKVIAGRQMLFGAATLAIALVLATQLVLSAVMGQTVGNVAAGFLGGLIALIWCVLPWVLRGRGHF
jgi:peptidoglycan biosynthesis protein MviN/MurJ (putative lipid II flippase)